MKTRRAFKPLLESLKGGDDKDAVPVFIESPKDRRNKYEYDPDLGLFTLGKVLPAGAVFPYDFGFIPLTRAEDGDPIDVLVLMDEPAFPGCLLAVRLIGVLEAKQIEDGKKAIRNDRLLGVATLSRDHRKLRKAGDLASNLREEIETFFVDYNRQYGRTFRPLGWHGPRRARQLLDETRRRFRRHAKPAHPSPSPAGHG